MKKILLSLFIISGALASFGQCPVVTCPGNITVGSDSGVCGAVVTTTVTAIDSCAPNVNQVFNYTGSVQFWVVPPGVSTVSITAEGAQGATSANPNNGNGTGGLGGTSTGNLAVTQGDTLWIYVGGQGQVTTQGNLSGGGFNGGGHGAAGYSGTGWLGGGGGGASDIRVGGQALTNRVIVAAGGGGGGSNCSTPNGNAAGDGGGSVGGAGISCTSAGFGNGGTQTAGGVANAYGWDCGSGPGVSGGNGALGVGGDADVCSAGGGGGGGYYGGAGGDFGGGGGGSCYLGGVTGGASTAGTRTGNGQITITTTGNPVTLTQIAGLPTGSQFPIGTTTNTYVASGTGPNDTCSFTVTVIDSGVATVLGPLSQDTICTSAGTMTLPAGTPAGGTYSGTGVTGNSFDPAVAQLGNHWVYYTDTVGCQNADSALITVVWCTGIEEGALSDIVTIAPNPSDGLFQLSIPQGEYFEKLELFDASGRKVWTANDPRNTSEIDLTNIADGLYMLHVGMKGQQQVFRILKK